MEKRLVEESLAARLSPALVKRVLQEPGLRRPGGVKQEVSILFSDIANFSRVTESMHPDDLVNLLNRYFDTALKCIHETDGTVMDLVGDAIFAIWNAPIAQPDHRERACRAALLLRQQLVDFGATQHSLPLRTRVGLHSGIVCVGNIGSATRFDFAAIGENTNLASRLEGLNKLVGTEVLATRDIQRAAEDSLVWRLVGHFKFKGFGRVVEVHELIGPTESSESSRAWREKFADALHDFRQRQFDSAAEKFGPSSTCDAPSGQRRRVTIQLQATGRRHSTWKKLTNSAPIPQPTNGLAKWSCGKSDASCTWLGLHEKPALQRFGKSRPSTLKREAERKVYRADGVTGAPIQIVAVLKPHRADNALPADAAPGRIDGLIRRIIPQVFREADAIHKSHQRQRRREELLKFHVSEQVRLGAQQISIRVARRSFALLIAAHRVFATGKKTLRKREFPVRATELERRAMPQAEMQEIGRASCRERV